MMTGELMSSGFDVVSIPFSRRLEFNNALDSLFSKDDGADEPEARPAVDEDLRRGDADRLPAQERGALGIFDRREAELGALPENLSGGTGSAVIEQLARVGVARPSRAPPDYWPSAC